MHHVVLANIFTLNKESETKYGKRSKKTVGHLCTTVR